MDDLALLIDFHRSAARQGPGSSAATRQAIALSGLAGGRGLKIADIGCGTGASTIELARALDAEITAVDFLAEFLEELETRAAAAGVSERITPLAAPMEELDFAAGSLDAVWSEGAIYNIGFEAGIAAWRRFLKPGGVLAVSELTWLTAERPADLDVHWNREYPEVATAAAKLAQLEAHGYTPLGYFALPEDCWLENYYRPMQARFAGFLGRHGHSEAAQALVAAEEAEMALYERNRAFVSYGFYIARKLPE
ncbi:class I SAM-dependent methyltransferase [Roseobacteraceae bacterium NS-SX3]